MAQAADARAAAASRRQAEPGGARAAHAFRTRLVHKADTLVVESNGYTDRSWLDYGGHPHTEHLRITERYERPSVGQIHVQLTLVDPKIYAKPITLSMGISLAADTEMLEAVCENNQRSRERMAQTKAAKVAQVPASVLARYSGTYDTDDDGTKHFVQITADGTSLWFDYDGKGRELLIPLSPTRSAPGRAYFAVFAAASARRAADSEFRML